MESAPNVAHDHLVHRSSFDIDDAFSDGDADDIAYQFSPDVIREDLAGKFDPGDIEPAQDIVSNGFFRTQSFSIADTSGEGEPSSFASRSPRSSTPDSEESGEFSQISLSGSTNDNHQEEECEEYPYPNVVVDASAIQLDASRVTFNSERGSRETIEHVSLPSSQSIDYPPQSAQSSQSPPTPKLTSQLVQDGIQRSTAPSTPAPSPLPSTSTIDSEPSSLPPPPLPQLQPTQKQFHHRPTRSTGPSAFEKVRSRTRPHFLPPKPREEDDKHMSDWKAMMEHSRAAAEKKRWALQERRLGREKLIEESISRWEKEVVPDWKVVHRNPALRKLWWKGIPSTLRASMWERAVGNPLALNKEHYRFCLARAKRALSSGVFPQPSLGMIEEDISNTLPSVHIFHRETGPLYQDLKDMLCAWVVIRSDEGLGYLSGAARIAAMLLITMPAQRGFVVMRNLLERHCIRSFFGGEGTKEEVEAYYRIFDTLLADGMPKIYFNFKQHQIAPASYLPDWLIPLFLDHLPFEACARIWDVVVLEGDSFLYRAALGMLAVLEPRLFFPDRKELLELLKGQNKAALLVAQREGRPLDGGKYEIYGVDEETLWERIDHMNDWWKESTWTRLLQRELPDL